MEYDSFVKSNNKTSSVLSDSNHVEWGNQMRTRRLGMNKEENRGHRDGSITFSASGGSTSVSAMKNC